MKKKGVCLDNGFLARGNFKTCSIIWRCHFVFPGKTLSRGLLWTLTNFLLYKLTQIFLQ